MQIRKGKPPGSGGLAGVGVELSREARVRLAWMDSIVVATTWPIPAVTSASAVRRFIVAARYDPYDLTSLEERSHRPRQCRQPRWAFSLEERVVGCGCSFRVGVRTSWRFCYAARRWRFRFPWWAAFSLDSSSKADSSNHRAAESPDRAAPCVSALRCAQTQGICGCGARRPGRSRYLGRPSIPGVVFKQFTARDVVSRWTCCKRTLAHRSNRHAVPRHFAAPHAVSIRAVQVDGGSELPPSSSRPANSAPPFVRSSSPFSQTQRRRRTRQSYSHRGVLPGHALLAGDEKTQPRAPPLGKNLQHRPPSSGSRLLNPLQFLRQPHPNERNESVTHLLDEYRGLPDLFRKEYYP